jgi:hypothetical protein
VSGRTGRTGGTGTPAALRIAGPPAVVLAAVLLAGCGSHGSTAGPAGTVPPGPAASAGASVPSPPPASELARMRKLVDDADSAAATADSDAAGDG